MWGCGITVLNKFTTCFLFNRPAVSLLRYTPGLERILQKVSQMGDFWWIVDWQSIFLWTRCPFCCWIDSGSLSQKSVGQMQNRKTKTNTNPSPDPNRYRRRCPDPNARIQNLTEVYTLHGNSDFCDSGLSPLNPRRQNTEAVTLNAEKIRVHYNCSITKIDGMLLPLSQ